MTQSLIPLYCLTGFVGSGKTTVLLGILKQYPEKKIGVIFTEPAIYNRQDLSREEDISIDVCDNGSLSCVCEEDALPRALEYMHQCEPEMVFVEVSGLSDPLRVKRILENEKNAACMRHYNIEGIICLVDADNFMEQIRDVEMVKSQLSHCQLAVINKADLVSPELLGVLQAQIRRINPDCAIASCSYGGFSLDLLKLDLPEQAQLEEDEHPGLSPDSIVVNCTHRLERDKVLAFLDRFKGETYRIKGFCLLENGWNQVDVVGTQVHLEPCMPHSSSRLIFISKIGHALSEPLRETWYEMIGLPMQLHD